MTGLHGQGSKRLSSSLATAMACGAAVMAQFVSGKATRDALFLTSLDYRTLPAMLVATSVCSLLLVALNARAARRIAPAALVPALFLLSGLLFLVEWLLRASAPRFAAVLVYLHVSGAGPLLASGFWLIASERFDPRTAKKRFGQIAGAGTLGGLLRRAPGRACGRALRRAGHAAASGGSSMSPARGWSVAWRSNRRHRQLAVADDQRRERAGALRAAGDCRSPVPAPPRHPRRCSARRARRSSTTSSRRRRSKRSDAAITCCGSSRSTTRPRAS